MHRMTLVVAVWCLVSVIAVAQAAPEPAQATPPRPAGLEAKAQRDLAKTLFSEQRYEDALAALKDAHRLAPSAAVALNIADTYRYLGVREERVAQGLKERAEKERSGARAETLYRDAYNWTEGATAFPMTEADRLDAEALRAKIQPRVALVDLATDPEGAAVSVDDQSASSHKSVAVSPGEHRVVVKVPGYRDGETTVSAALGERRSVRMVLDRLFAPVRVESQPPGAKVEIAGGGKAVGQTPFLATFPVTTVRVSVSLDGYVSQTRDVEVLPGDGVNVVILLERAPSTVATLSVTGNPPGAAVKVDGRPVGEVPLSLPSLEPGAGRARVEVAAPGHVAWSDLVALEAGSATRVKVELSRAGTPLGLGWKIAGYGTGVALALTGGGIGIWATRERQAFYQDPSVEHFNTTGRLNTTADVLMGTGLAVAVTTVVFHLLGLVAPPSRGDISIER